MKVFLSSVVRGLETYRDAASRAAHALRHEIKRAEDFAASAATPQQACLAGVRWADVVILLLGTRYGDRQPSGTCRQPTRNIAKRENAARCSYLYNRTSISSRSSKYSRAKYKTGLPATLPPTFSTPEEFRDQVTAALRDLELSRAVGPVDESEMLNRARALLPNDRQSLGARLILVVAGGPRQQVVRPRDLESQELEEFITREALFGSYRIFDRRRGTRCEIRDEQLAIDQDKNSVLLDQLGTIRLVLSLEPQDDQRVGLAGVAIQEDVEEYLQKALKFAGSLLDHVDALRRISDIVIVAALQGALTWRTRAEHQRSPNSYSVRLSTDAAVVQLTPARRHRAALIQDTGTLAEDLTVLLGRRLRP